MGHVPIVIGMQALVHAGGKGTRMGTCSVEKPMQVVGGRPTVMRVVDALKASAHIDDVFVSVNGNTPRTESYLREAGVNTIRTSGKSFVDDLNEAFEHMGSRFILTCPADIPLLSVCELDRFIGSFDFDAMQSMIALVSKETTERFNVVPSYTVDHEGKEWVLSGITITNRELVLKGEYLKECYYTTDCKEFAINVNTQSELSIAKRMVEGT